MNRIDPPGVMLHFEWIDPLQQLSHEQLGRLFLAILEYGKTGTVPKWDDRFLLFVWNVLRPHLDLDRKRYEAVVEKRREAANKRWNSQSDSAAQRTCTPRTSRSPGLSAFTPSSRDDGMDRYL